jgi:hypothetical protein
MTLSEIVATLQTLMTQREPGVTQAAHYANGQFTTN